MAAPPELLRFTVASPDVGKRLDLALQGWVPELSRTRVQALIASGDVQVEGGPARPGWRLREGASITLRVPAPEPSSLRPEAMPLEIVHEDDELLVVNKPAGLVVHPGAGHRSGTLVHALLAHCGPSLAGIGGVERPGIVHRLDRGTSGLLVVAKTERAHQALTSALKARLVERRYVALVHGGPARAEGTVEMPIGRHPVDRQRMAVTSPGSGRSAVTHFTVRERFERPISLALLGLRLGSGRTHQIRVHLTHIGHPVVGDPVYRRHATLPLPEQLATRVSALGGPALHAGRLGFEHPGTGRRMVFEAALPAPFAALLAWLRAGRGVLR